MLAEPAAMKAPWTLGRLPDSRPCSATCQPGTLRPAAAWRSSGRRHWTPTSGGASNGGAAVVTWPGLEIIVPEGFHAEPAWALPLRVRSDVRPSRSDEWEAGPDYSALTRALSTWHRNSSVLPACPLCAGVAYYKGPLFSHEDIETGWNPYLLCSGQESRGASAPTPLEATMMHCGIPDELSPSMAIQLRPSGASPLADAEAEALDCQRQIWRGRSLGLAEFVVSVSVLASHRLTLCGQTAASLGLEVFFCEQVGKYAQTSRTRVGRYLDDQIVATPRAHVFGVVTDGQRGFRDIVGSLVTKFVAEDVNGSGTEECPFCGAAGNPIRRELVALVALRPEEAGETTLPFVGALWLCEHGAHVWGWRMRRCLRPVMED
eukprot:TRINITY_DN90550_c0_g1_i1.p1 TRINITY_DN90550_c0_g1~~TRINITY_DN90550_c0_g1_i1.p1  ORF type:complete len:394 (+),score=47.79 TRINITY_DN90550_c0_g1_i1:56-1183(+)